VGFALPTLAFGTMRQPPKGIGLMHSTPPAMITSACRCGSWPLAMAMVSLPLLQ
jgi:hypothetical protein